MSNKTCSFLQQYSPSVVSKMKISLTDITYSHFYCNLLLYIWHVIVIISLMFLKINCIYHLHRRWNLIDQSKKMVIMVKVGINKGIHPKLWKTCFRQLQKQSSWWDYTGWYDHAPIFVPYKGDTLPPSCPALSRIYYIPD